MTGAPSAVVKGRGECLAGADVQEIARSQILRYADPTARALVSSIGQATGRYAGPLDSRRVSIVVVTEFGCSSVLAEYVNGCERGFVSPARYVAASPGAMCGIACVVFSISGPSITLTSPIGRALPVAVTMSKSWLEGSLVDLAIIANADLGAARCIILGRSISSASSTPSLNEALDWLSTDRS